MAMRLDHSQQMRQEQVAGPALIQSMHILALPLAELEERINEELESNAALEVEERRPDEDAAAKAEETDDRSDRRELVVGEGSTEDDFRRLNDFTGALKEAFDDDTAPRRATSGDDRDPKAEAMAQAPARGPSLAEQLLEQWHLADIDARERRAGELLIEQIEPDGLLRTPLAEIVAQARLVPETADVDEALLERTLRAFQRVVDPPGIGARTQQECLSLQLDAILDDPGERHDLQSLEDAREIVAHHFEALARNEIPRIANESGLTIARIGQARDAIRRLDPAPGRTLAPQSAIVVRPDVIIEYDEEADEYRAHLADRWSDRLRVSPEVEQMAKGRGGDRPTKDFARTHVRNARQFLAALEERRRTLMRVVDVVLARQRDFFDQGAQAIRPLEMTEVAEQLELHVSTVSRAVKDKWLLTPRGFEPLRRFFTSGLETDGEAIGKEGVLAMVKDVVDAEDRRKPLSDQAICDALKEKGIRIARRTVREYREQLGIPKAELRREFE